MHLFLFFYSYNMNTLISIFRINRVPGDMLQKSWANLPAFLYYKRPAHMYVANSAYPGKMVSD